MKKIGLMSQMDQVKELPSEVRGSMADLVMVLEESYGVERDIERHLGGYVVVLEVEEERELLTDMKLNMEANSPEWVDEIITENGQVWQQALFVLSSDFSIVVIGTKEIIGL